MILRRAILIVLMSMTAANAAPKVENTKEIRGKPRVGQIGKPGTWFVMQRISETEALVRVDVYGVTFKPGTLRVNSVMKVVATHLIYCKGFNFKNSTDGDRFPFYGVVKVTGIHTFKTVTGASSTVPLVEPSTPVLAQAKNRKKTFKDLKRTWKDRTGKFQIEAVLTSIGDETIVLKKADKSTITVEVSKLSTGDQQYVEEKRLEKQAASRPLRTWRTKGGNTLLASFVKLKGTKVHLLEEGGRRRTVTISNLTKADQKYARQQQGK